MQPETHNQLLDRILTLWLLVSQALDRAVEPSLAAPKQLLER